MGHLAHLKKIAAGIAVVGALTAMSITPALAVDTPDSSTASASVVAGNRSVTLGDVTFAPSQYKFGSQSVTAIDVQLGVIDESGTNGGWQVSMQSTDLENAGATVSIPATGFMVTAVDTIAPAGPVAGMGVNTGSLGVGQVVLNAAAGTGAGTYTANVDFSLTIPAGQAIDSYSGTLTTTIVVAPV